MSILLIDSSSFVTPYLESLNSTNLHELAVTMQLLLLCFCVFFSLALGSPADVLYIKKLIADESQLLDSKDFRGLANIFTTNAIYNAGPPSPDRNGIENIQATLAIILKGIVTQISTSTESITLLAPFDEQGAAGTATGVVYYTAVEFGTGDSAGKTEIILAKYVDKYVKTGDRSRYDGWRISERRSFIFVSDPEWIDSWARGGKG